MLEPDFLTTVSRCAHLLWHSPTMALGTFKAQVNDPEFAVAGSPEHHHLLAFPTGPGVWIRYAGQPPFVADPTVVTFYNPGQEYRRERLSEAGDECVWVALRPDLARELMAACSLAAAQREALFPFTHGPSPRHAYLMQRLIASRLKGDCGCYDFLIEEVLLNVVSRTVESVFQAGGGALPAPCGRPQTPLVREVHAVIAAQFCEALSLQQISRQVGSSVFRLCRVFRRETGWTIHSWLTELRLRASLEMIPDSRGELTDIAMRLGFSSHPHFTASFRTRFGITPSQYRRLARTSSMRQLKEFLKPEIPQPPMRRLLRALHARQSANSCGAAL